MNGPSHASRITAAILIGFLFGGLTWYSLAIGHSATQGGDFTYAWLAARFVLRGHDPYLAMRTAVTPFEHVFLYPLPAAFVALPLAWISAPLAGVLFVGFGCAWLAFVVSREGVWRLLMFASAPAYMVVWSVQWSAFLMACALTVPTVGLLIAKPNVGIPLLALQSSVRAITRAAVSGSVLTLISLALFPSWPLHWIETLQGAVSGYRAPILTPVGAFVGLAALRWRRPDARLLLCMACLPQSGFFYDQFPLLLIPGFTSRTLDWLNIVCPCFPPGFVRPISRDDGCSAKRPVHSIRHCRALPAGVNYGAPTPK